MCGRYALFGPSSRLRERFGVEQLDWIDMYNVAPTQLVTVVRADADGHRVTISARWGLLPSWVKEPGKLNQPINAKAETAAEKPMFRHAYRMSRVLVPASGFYEWQQVAGSKVPYFIRIRGEDEPMAFGGLLERWEGPDGGVVWSFCVLTTDANALVAPLHNRMPVIIRPADYDAWLDPKLTDPNIIRTMTGPYPADLMEAYPVGRAVGNPRSQGPDLIRPIA